VPLAVPVAVSTAPAPATSAATLSSAAATTSALFRLIAALAVNRTISPGLKGNCGGLTTTGANHGSAGTHATTPAAKTAIMLGMGRSMTAPGRTLLGLAARFAASRRRVAAFLKELLLSGGEDKFLTAVATRK